MFLWANAFTEKTVLPDSSIRRMFTSQVPDAGTGGESSFGYGCSIRETDQHTELIDNEGTNGVYFARLIRMPREGLVFYMITNESTVNSFRVLPNITQLYLQGHISQDAMTDPPKFESPVAEQIYEILNRPKTRDLRKELEKSNLKVDNHMLLLQVGRTLIQEKKVDQAVLLYRYYTKTFPEVVVAWNDLGDLYQMKDDAQEAIKCYRQALVLHPDNTRARDNLARLNPFIGN
jgi:tetratricopeptide (TPR) repeat protein